MYRSSNFMYLKNNMCNFLASVKITHKLLVLYTESENCIKKHTMRLKT